MHVKRACTRTLKAPDERLPLRGAVGADLSFRSLRGGQKGASWWLPGSPQSLLPLLLSGYRSVVLLLHLSGAARLFTSGDIEFSHGSITRAHAHPHVHRLCSSGSSALWSRQPSHLIITGLLAWMVGGRVRSRGSFPSGGVHTKEEVRGCVCEAVTRNGNGVQRAASGVRGGRDSLVLVLGALQMCVILGHRVERDAADFTAVAAFQTWKPGDKHEDNSQRL